MFRKPFKIKSNTAIRGSERRKLRENVSKVFKDLPTEKLSEIIPNKEEISVMKIFTHNERNVTCYCLKKIPILFEIDELLFPTVYFLWDHAFEMLSFRTPPNVLSVLNGGADLMFPGVIPPGAGFQDFNTKAVCCVTLLGNGSAVAVGATACSKQDLINEGMKGKRVHIYHCYKDYLWSIGDKRELPLTTDLPKVILNGESESCSEIIDLENPGKMKVIEGDSIEITDVQVNDGSLEEINDDDGHDEEIQKSPQELMDELLENCFCQALLDAKKIELPVLVSKFSSQYLHQACPDGQRIDVKKSSHKKMSKFLAKMQENGLVQVMELSKGVESITKITLENEIIRLYKQSEFAHLKKDLKEMKLTEDRELQKQQNKEIEIRDLFSVSAKTVPFFKLFKSSKGDVLASGDIRKLVTLYVKENNLVDQTDKKKIRLDPLLSDILTKKGEYVETLTWDALLARFTVNMNLCHEVTIPGQQPVIRKGKMECVELTIEKKMGNKKVTIIKNLELFGVDVKTFARELQQQAASSTSVLQSVGKNTNNELVQVQGVQMKHIKHLLETHKIPKKYIKGLDQVKEKKKR